MKRAHKYAFGIGYEGLPTLLGTDSVIPESGTSPIEVYGTITGPVVENVIVYALDPVTRAIVSSGISNSGGAYSIPNLQNGVTYDILPYIVNHIFTPHQTQVTLAGADILGVDFVSAAGATYLYDETTISIVDDSGNRLYEAI